MPRGSPQLLTRSSQSRSVVAAVLVLLLGFCLTSIFIGWSRLRTDNAVSPDPAGASRSSAPPIRSAPATVHSSHPAPTDTEQQDPGAPSSQGMSWFVDSPTVLWAARLIQVDCPIAEVHEGSRSMVYLEGDEPGGSITPYPLGGKGVNGHVFFHAPRRVSKMLVAVYGLGRYRVRWTPVADRVVQATCVQVERLAGSAAVTGQVVSKIGAPPIDIKIDSCGDIAEAEDDGFFFIESFEGPCTIQACTELPGGDKCCGAARRLVLRAGQENLVELSAPVESACKPRDPAAWNRISCATKWDLYRMFRARTDDVLGGMPATSTTDARFERMDNTVELLRPTCVDPFAEATTGQ